MKVKYYVILCVTVASLGMSACGPILYSTTGQNVPLFHKKGEVAFSAGQGMASGDDLSYLVEEEANGFAGQFAAAVGNSTAVMASFYSLKGSEDDVDWKGKGNYFEIGAGKFKHNEGKNFVGEVFIGVGFGSQKNSYEGEFIDVKYIKPFLQPSWGLSSKYIDIAITPRIAFVSYTNQSSSINDPGLEQSFKEFYSEKKNTFVFEPGITIRGGYQQVKLQFQWNHTTFKFEQDDYNPVFDDYFSVGLFFMISD